MITLSKLINFLDSYLNFDNKLEVAKIDPFMSNSLMVRGSNDIVTIGFGVSASISLFEEAKKFNCQAIINHHTFNFPQINKFDNIFQTRINFLLKNSISLFGYHFLLDCHPEVGNNVVILKTIGCRPTQPFEHHGSFWGWQGEYKNGKSFTEIKKKLVSLLSHKATFYNFGPSKIKKVVAVSGKGAPSPFDMQRLIELKIDLFITGEVHEWNRELFKEAEIHLIAGGHYATEVFGIKALMEKVQHQFPQVKTAWLEVYNEI